MQFIDSLKKRPTELTPAEKRAVGLIYVVNASAPTVDIFDIKSETRLLDTAELLKGKKEWYYNKGVEAGRLTTTLFARYKKARAYIDDWRQTAELNAANCIAAALAQGREDATKLLKRCRIPTDITPARTREIDIEITAEIYAWRALMQSLAKALTLPRLVQLADLDNTAAALAESNSNAIKIALFLQDGFLNSEEAEEVKWQLITPADFLRWEPDPIEVEKRANALNEIEAITILDTYKYFYGRRLQSIHAPETDINR